MVVAAGSRDAEHDGVAPRRRFRKPGCYWLYIGQITRSEIFLRTYFRIHGDAPALVDSPRLRKIVTRRSYL
jgi:hypothetical protein